ncbi:MAG: hypothetical protein KKF65_03510 [Nanoarchaeota archaeon]|nr:hypothetical protein [Nanoarchaeota archaeon]
MIEIQFKKKTYKQFLEIKSPLLESITDILRQLQINPYLGDLIPRKNLSKKTISYYGTNKLFRIALINYWRLIYIIIGKEDRTIVLILEFFNHKNYNKRFGYKNK